jgi:DNA-binding MarR family transcriptional regulator
MTVGGTAAVPLTIEEEAFLRSWSRAMLTVPRALGADLLGGQGMPLSDYSTLMHLSEAPGRTLRMSDLAAARALSFSGMSRIVARLEAQGLPRAIEASLTHTSSPLRC